MYDSLDVAVPFWRVVEMGRPIVLLIISCLLVIGGIGLMMRGRWGRWLSVIYVAVNIPLQLVFIIYELAAVYPAMEAVIKTVPGAGAGPPPISKAIMFATVGIFLLYSVALMLGLFVPAASEALAPAPPAEEYDDGEETDDDGDDYDYR